VRLATAFSLCAVLRGGEFCSPPDGQPRHSFQFFAGYSPTSATLIGTAKDRRFVAAGFSYSYRCWIWGPVSLSYTPTAMPAAILLQPRQFAFLAPNLGRVRPAHAVYGFAVAPLGFTLEIGPARKAYPFVETIEGVIASTQPIPEYRPNATGLNFLFDLGGGIRWNFARRSALTLGYRFLHISNAATTNYNPGVDNNVLYLGYSFALGPK
jgi:hypothetical protein